MLRTHARIGGHPLSVSIDLGPEELAACAHAARVARERRFRLGELSTDDVVALRELTVLVDALDSHVLHGAADTVTLTIARLVELNAAINGLLERPQEHEWAGAEADRHLRVAAELSFPLGEVVRDAMAAALGDDAQQGEDDAWDDDALRRLLGG